MPAYLENDLRGAEHSVDVGPVSESRQEHLRRHDGGRDDCPRCRFYLLGEGWIRAYGSTQDPRTNDRTPFIWLQERPQRFQGQWALGCAFCAHDTRTETRTPCGYKRRRGKDREVIKYAFSKFSRYESKGQGNHQGHHIRKHALISAHTRAVARFFASELPLTVLLPKNVEEEELLQGAVPQLEAD